MSDTQIKSSNMEVEGPYSHKGADGLKTPVYIFLPGGEKKIIGETTVTVDGGMTFDVQLQEEYKDIEVGSFEVPMRYSFINESPGPKVNWGFNCLTRGIHHGRPETIWNLPLFQAAYMFRKDQLQELVLARIYTDAMQYVEYGDNVKFDEAWAEKVRDNAEKHYLTTLKHKIGEIGHYYQSAGFELEQQEIVRRVKENKLNSHYEPRHPHDTINLLCRILGSSASRAVS